MKKYDLIEIYSVAICLLFAIAISLYHISFDGYLGLSETNWNVVYTICNNGFSIALCNIIILYGSSLMRKIMLIVFIPYFVVRLIYHFSCYSGVYLLAKGTWENIWSVILVILILMGLVYCLQLIKGNYVA